MCDVKICDEIELLPSTQQIEEEGVGPVLCVSLIQGYSEEASSRLRESREVREWGHEKIGPSLPIVISEKIQFLTVKLLTLNPY